MAESTCSLRFPSKTVMAWPKQYQCRRHHSVMPVRNMPE